MNEAMAWVVGLIESEMKTCQDLSDHVAYCPAKHLSEVEASVISQTYGIKVVRL